MYPYGGESDDEDASCPDVLESHIERLIADEVERAKLRNAVGAVDAGRHADAGIDLSDAVGMKLLTDGFLLDRFCEAEGVRNDD
jgi:hypothetical protein